jgi:hypothetical protein
MQPLTALIGIVMGSAVSLLAGLTMTLLVFLFLPEFRDRLQGEFQPLVFAIVWAAVLTAAAAAAFFGQLRQHRWRVYGLLTLTGVILAMGRYYWP